MQEEVLEGPVTQAQLESAPTFEFDLHSSNDKYRQPIASYITDDNLTPEERHRLILERNRKREEARNRQISVSKISTPQSLIDVENQPAYMRRSVHLDNVAPSNIDAYSTWTLDMQTEQGDLKLTGNKHLDRPVD
jgi:hypothetical protein